MANTSIFAAFERMWQHIVALVGGKANAEHEHDNYIPVDEKGAPNGVATLNESGIIPSSQLPSYVDDVLEFATRASFPATGESGKIYVDTTANVTYRWSGSTYTEISKSLALGTTASTAAAGNHGHKLSELENDSSFATTEYVDTKAACLTVNVTKSGTTFSADTTFSVISAAIDNNTAVCVKYNNTIYYPALKTVALIMFRSHGSSSEDIINIMSSDVVTAAYSSLPVATEDSLGGIKSGGDISVDTDGIVTVNPSVVQEAYDLANTANTVATNALPKSGGEMTGALTLAGDPTENLHAATKQYVDANANNVFIAEYGVTPIADIQAASDAGKQIFCKVTDSNGYTQYAAGYRAGSKLFRFIAFDWQKVCMIQLINTSWTDVTDNGFMMPIMDTSNRLRHEMVAIASNNYTTKQVRNIILVADGEEIPAGANGDICLVYAP